MFQFGSCMFLVAFQVSFFTYIGIWEPTIKLELLVEPESIHNVFHLCYLRKFLGQVSDMILISKLSLEENRRIVEDPREIVYRKTKQLQRKMIDLMLVQWKHTARPNLTWETKSGMRSLYPQLLLMHDFGTRLLHPKNTIKQFHFQTIKSINHFFKNQSQ